ncbi:MAG: DNA methylase N-4/N-6 domain-containing protein [Puniceicoccaceae bacterium 5H]|nr:MAG: DNA methylase N-4/N-6 domain-containing protein [Puniceicoccaceae bacterium 5H]
MAHPAEVVPFLEELAQFRLRAEGGIVDARAFGDHDEYLVPTYLNEFWTARQRQAAPIHEVPYRACFKPQLPRFFIERLTAPGDLIYDPFMGRGTTLIEGALRHRRVAGCDLNALSRLFTAPRLTPPSLEAVMQRLSELDLESPTDLREDLRVFYHHDTLRELTHLRRYLNERGDEADAVDHWLRLVALTRLTGHSSGFLSVYTLPPNQAVSIAAQKRINERRDQAPPRRELRPILIKKTRSLLRGMGASTLQTLREAGDSAAILTQDARQVLEIADNSVQLTVTSPPFLDVVNYEGDNWLRLWFAGVPGKLPGLITPRTPEAWATAMAEVFREVWRITRPGGYLACEVGEVRHGQVQLEQYLIPAVAQVGWHPVALMQHQQAFTKTAHCWGVSNNSGGTNSHRIAVFQKV